MRPERTTVQSLIQALPGLVLLALLAWGVFAGAKWLLGVITEAESDVVAAFIAASIAVIGSVISLAVGKIYETQAAIRNDLRQKKTPVYEDIVHTLLYDVMFSKILGKEVPSEADLMEFFARITQKLTIWGSDDVLRIYGEFKTNAANLNNPTQSIFMFEDLLLAIRKDLGHPNKGVGRKAILRLFVTDIDTATSPAQHADATNQPSGSSGRARRSSAETTRHDAEGRRE